MRSHSLVSAALCLVLAGLFLLPAGFAPRVAVNTIDPAATLSADGRRVFLSGPISNDRTETVDLRVTVTQRATGAIAHGRVRFTGSTTQQQWEAEATVEGSAVFEPGPATAVAAAVTSVRGVANDAHQWLVDIELEEED